MKYTPELTKQITEWYVGTKATETTAEVKGLTVPEICTLLEPEHGEVPERSIIAKLSSVGVYKKKEYVTKRGEIPIKKEEYIERISVLLDVNQEMLESLEKVNKNVLALLESRLQIARDS